MLRRMLRRAYGLVLVLFAGCENPPAVATSSTAASSGSGASIGSAAPPVSSLGPRVDMALFERARAVVKGCPWNDDTGFGECKPLDAVLAPKLAPPPAFATAELMLADGEPRLRRVGLSILNEALAASPAPLPPLSTSLALIKAAETEAVPALELRLAMAAASLPKSDELRAPLEKLLRSASTPKRATALVFLSKGEADPPWVKDILLESTKDKDPEIRIGATRGLFGRFVSHRSETCAALAAGLSDEDVRVRDAARFAIVGNIDVMIDDPKRGLIGGRASPFSKPCDEAEVAAAYARLDKDVREKKVSLEARALFHNGALLHMAWKGADPPDDKAGKRRDLAVKDLTAIAKDKKAPVLARLTAIRGLRLKIAGDTKQTLGELAKDADETVAKAASTPVGQ